MIYSAPCVLFLMPADSLRGEVGGGGGGMALEIESFLGPLKWHKPIGECHLGPEKPTSPSNGSTRIKIHYTRGRINHRWFYELENYLIGLRGPVYLSGSMKQYRRVYGGVVDVTVVITQKCRMGLIHNLKTTECSTAQL
jgi:hypothetical protein